MFVAFAIILASFLFADNSQADEQSFNFGSFQCTRHGQDKDCSTSFYDYNASVTHQLYKVGASLANYEGFGSHGSVSVDVCLSQTSGMWNSGDSCWNIIDANFKEIKYPNPPAAGPFQIDNFDTRDYNQINVNVRVNDATIDTYYDLTYRRVSNLVAGPIQARVNEPFAIEWNTEWATDHTELFWENAKREGGTSVGGSATIAGPSVRDDGSISFTASTPGKAFFTIKSWGPGQNGLTSVEDGVEVQIIGTPTPTPAPEPTQANLNFNVRDVCTNSALPGALVTINRDFGNGTLRTTDGNGFANFGVDKNTNIDWSVSANGYSTSTGGINSGLGAGVTVSLNRNCSGSPPPTENPPPPEPSGYVTLAVRVSGDGTVRSNDGRISCRALGPCYAVYPLNTTLELTGSPDSGWSFESWLGDCGTIQGNVCYMSMTRDKDVVGNFRDSSTVTPTPTPTQTSIPTQTGSVIIESVDSTNNNPVLTNWTLYRDGSKVDERTNSSGLTYSGMNIGQYRLDPLVSGTTHTLKQVIVTCSTGGTCGEILPAAGSLKYRIEYQPKPPTTYLLSITKEGSGTVTGPGINCGSDCNERFGQGTIINTLHPDPASGWAFNRWEGDCGSSGVCTMSSDKTVKAVFIQTNTTTPSPTPSSTPGPGKGDISVTTTCGHTYTFYRNGVATGFGGTGNMTFRDKPTGSYRIEWEPIPVTYVSPAETQTLGDRDTIEFNLTCSRTGGGEPNPEDKVAEAVCTVSTTSQYVLTVSKNGSGSGTVSGSGISCGSDCSEAFNSGTSVSLSVSPAAGSTFAGWSGACSGNGSCNVTMNGDKSVTATFNSNPTASNINVTEPNYCLSGPGGTISWSYSDPSGSPQASYQVQVDDQGGFNAPEVDSGVVNSNSTAYAIPNGALIFNVTYRARARVWNSNGAVSDWIESKTWKTPANAYPQVDFSWSPLAPAVKNPVQFTDQTTFSGNQNGRQWSWNFGDNGTSSQQNPPHTYQTDGSYYVSLSATDSANQTCSVTKGPIIIQKAAPKWREVAPK